MAYFTRSRLLLLMLPSGTPVPPAPPPPAGGDSTGYRRKRRTLRRIFKRNAAVRAQAEAFLAESAETLAHAGVLKGNAQEELVAFHDVLTEILYERKAKERVNRILYESVVDALLQALAAEVEREEELDEEAIVLHLVGLEFGLRPTYH